MRLPLHDKQGKSIQTVIEQGIVMFILTRRLVHKNLAE